jgi:hypothetical protein
VHTGKLLPIPESAGIISTKQGTNIKDSKKMGQDSLVFRTNRQWNQIIIVDKGRQNTGREKKGCVELSLLCMVYGRALDYFEEEYD